MPLGKAQGNMYDWVTHTWSCINGECPHRCDYCYVKRGRFTKDSPNYRGPPRFNENDNALVLGSGKKIFVAHTGDLFAEAVDAGVIARVLNRCIDYPDNIYIFQTKNPARALDWCYPKKTIIGTTIETNDAKLLAKISKAPAPLSRARAMRQHKQAGRQTFVTIEPIMRFDIEEMTDLILLADPDTVNIGADSKGSKLQEPTWQEVQELIQWLKQAGIPIGIKSNLERLRGAD